MCESETDTNSYFECKCESDVKPNRINKGTSRGVYVYTSTAGDRDSVEEQKNQTQHINAETGRLNKGQVVCASVGGWYTLSDVSCILYVA